MNKKIEEENKKICQNVKELWMLQQFCIQMMLCSLQCETMFNLMRYMSIWNIFKINIYYLIEFIQSNPNEKC